MTDGDDALVFSGIASNTRNPLTRPVEMTEDEVRDAMFDSGCGCSGECECWVEPDGECPYGWPSKLRAIGLI
jgi:hypothetical protein